MSCLEKARKKYEYVASRKAVKNQTGIDALFNNPTPKQFQTQILKT